MSAWKLGMALAAILCGIQFTLAQQGADTILHNGKVLTVDRNFSVVEAVAVRDGKIAAVGKSDDVLKLAGPNTLKVDLKGKTVTPGLINTHVHLESPGGYGTEMPAAKRKTYPLNLRAVKTKDDVLKQIKDAIAAFKFKPGEWIFFPTNPRGDQARLLFDELNASELNKAAPHNPIVLSLGVPIVNVLLVNGKAIEALWAKYGDFIEKYGRYWIDPSGKPDGHLEPPAVRILLEDEEFLQAPAPEDVGPQYRKLLVEDYSALGTTTISGALHSSSVRAYQWLDSRGEMPVRYGYGVMATFGIPGREHNQYRMGAGTDTVWITSMSSRAVDGAGSRMCISIKRDAKAVAGASERESRMMGLSAGDDWWPRGQCSLDIEYNGSTRGARVRANYFKEWYAETASAGLRSANVHVDGDASHSMMLSMMEEIDRMKAGSVKGWALDHCELIDPRDFARIAKLGIMMSCAVERVERGSEEAKAFGENVAHTYFEPIKSMIDAGINVSLESGWDGVEALITRKGPDGKVWGPNERTDRVMALRIATQNGANYVLKGDELGSIEPGKFADLVILDRDYMTMPEDQISEIRPLMTMLGGKIIFLRTDFSSQYNLKPASAEISTYEELQKRRPVDFGGQSGG